ncbi:MAG: hypothetical protein K2K92_08400 [Duncaniella sp.]|nr:hypothetical protein [Duncaniella sp.]
MKIKLIIWILLLGTVVASCNDEVFVRRPVAEVPPDVEPDTADPGESTDSMILVSASYNDWPLEVKPEDLVLDAETHFENHTSSSGVGILFDNYNSTLVRISNSTYYVVPWARCGQPSIEIPGLDKEGIPGFYGAEIPFAFGLSVLPHQYMPGHIEHFDLPPHSEVTARICTTRRVVTGRADIIYYNTGFPNSLEKGWVDVQVSVPVDIRVEWSEIKPL